MLVIAHREELLTQAADKIHRANPNLSIGLEQAESRASSFNDVVLASIQTLSARGCARLDRLIKTRPFRIVVVDEAHHAAAPSYRTVLAHLGFLPMADVSDEQNAEAATLADTTAMAAALADWDTQAPKDRLLVGCTATPNRTDAIGLGCVFQTIAFSYPLKQAIDDGWLVEPVPWVVETDTSLDHVRVNRGEFNQRELADTVNTAGRNRMAVAAWQEYAADRQTIAFTVDVAHAHALAAEFTAAGVNARALSGETPKDERAGMLQAFRDGRIDVLTNCMVLTEGTDLPMTGCILHAKPTKSATLYAQMTGRGLRLHPGKPDCIVIDMVDVARKHTLQAAPVLYGLPPGFKAQGKTLSALEAGLAKILAEHPTLNVAGLSGMTLEELQERITASTFNVWSILEMGEYAAGLTLNWLRTGETTFRLEYPWPARNEEKLKEILTVEPDLLGHFDVKLQAPDAAVTVQATGLQTAQAALRLAETFVQQHRGSVTGLASKTATWRGGPATGKQIAFLHRLRVHTPPGLSKGEASDLIARAKYSRFRGRA